MFYVNCKSRRSYIDQFVMKLYIGKQNVMKWLKDFKIYIYKGNVYKIVFIIIIFYFEGFYLPFTIYYLI